MAGLQPDSTHLYKCRAQRRHSFSRASRPGSSPNSDISTAALSRPCAVLWTKSRCLYHSSSNVPKAPVSRRFLGIFLGVASSPRFPINDAPRLYATAGNKIAIHDIVTTFYLSGAASFPYPGWRGTGTPQIPPSSPPPSHPVCLSCLAISSGQTLELDRLKPLRMVCLVSIAAHVSRLRYPHPALVLRKSPIS